MCPAQIWLSIDSRSMFAKPLATAVEAAILKREETLDLKAVKEALNLERAVPGADLVVNRYSLETR